MRTWKLIVLAVLGLAAAEPADADPYYYGQWQFGTCSLSLKGPEGGRLKAETQACHHEWAFVRHWRVSVAGVELLDLFDKVLVRLADADGQLVVISKTGTRVAFDRQGGPPRGRGARGHTAWRGGGPGALTVGPPHSYALQYMNQSGRCVLRGDKGTCASERDLGIPTSIPSNAPPDGRTAVITLVTSPAFRARIGHDQPLLFEPKGNHCIPVSSCYETAAGPWCYAHLNNRLGYIAKFARTKDGALMVNFVNGCDPGAVNLVQNR